MKLLSALLAGILFAFGLVLSGMTDSARVLAFLDVTGAWDPSLALVMAAALCVYAPAYQWIVRTRTRPLSAEAFHLPSERPIDAWLLSGAALFGVGWGLSGFCPGPALVASAAGVRDAALVALGMLIGIPLGDLAWRLGRADGGQALSQT